MNRVLGVVCVVAACGGGGDDASSIDAPVQTVSHDLSCVGHTRTPPADIHLDSSLNDVTSPPPFPPIVGGEVQVYSLDGTQLVTSATSDDAGNFALDLPGGQLTRWRYVTHPTGYMDTRQYVSLAPWVSVMDPDRARFIAAKQAHADAIATALGTTVDASKGSLEVWLIDCGGHDLKGETLTIAEDPGTQWAMLANMGVWLPRATTLGSTGQPESVAATVNVAPGPKTITWTASGQTLGPVDFTIEAGTHTIVVLVPGYPL